jgi:hypothetical protein
VPRRRPSCEANRLEADGSANVARWFPARCGEVSLPASGMTAESWRRRHQLRAARRDCA